MRTFRSRNTSMVAVLTLSTLGFAPRVVQGQSAGGRIYGCVDNSKGALRIVSGAGLCDARKESPLSWSAGTSGEQPAPRIKVVPLPQVKADTSATCNNGEVFEESFSDPVHLDAGVYRLSVGGMHTLQTTSTSGVEAFGGGSYTVDVRTGADDITRLAFVDRSQVVGQNNDIYTYDSESPVFQFAGGTIWVKSKARVSGCALVQADGVGYIERVD